MADPRPPKRQTDDGAEIFAATADGIRRWAETTDPPPSEQDVLEHVTALRRDGIIPDAEVAELAKTYPALAA